MTLGKQSSNEQLQMNSVIDFDSLQKALKQIESDFEANYELPDSQQATYQEVLSLFASTMDKLKSVSRSKPLGKLTPVPIGSIKEDYDYQTVSQIEPAKPSLMAVPLRTNSDERQTMSPHKH